ncbi:unnamed protein product [Brachionus calyciflorus]|uniref:Uncharacterized protein n=1 Tax=Brachionus calyciflorus TaxID=104777 RepID=A0A813TP21_9BILA|nr:unnamed protein product [Brachionus calyciflorus]
MANFIHYGKPKNISTSELLSSAQINHSVIKAENNTLTGSDDEMNLKTEYNDHKSYKDVLQSFIKSDVAVSYKKKTNKLSL